MSLESWLKSKGILEPLEQFAHFWMGVGASLVNLGLLLWWREWKLQWPPGNPFRIHNPNGVNAFFLKHWKQDEYEYQNLSDEIWWTSLDRVQDTSTDLFWMEVGRTVGWFCTVGIGVLLGWLIWGG